MKFSFKYVKWCQLLPETDGINMGSLDHSQYSPQGCKAQWVTISPQRGKSEK